MGSWIGKDGTWYDSLDEKLKADTKYEQNQKQIYELQRANSLEVQRIREERQNAERIAEATRQAEIERQEHEQEMRYHRLCDDLKMNYDDILIFNKCLNLLTEKQLKECKDNIQKYEDFIYTDEIRSLHKKNEENKCKIQLLQKEHDQEHLTVPNVKIDGKQLSATRKQIQKYINQNNNIISNHKKKMMWITVVSIIILGFAREELFYLTLLVGGILDLVYWIKLSSVKNGLELMKKTIDDKEVDDNEFSNKIQSLKEQNKKNDEQIKILTEKRISDLEKDTDYQNLLNVYNKSQKTIAGELFPNQEQFYNFRIEHFNRDVEMLFKKLGLDFGKIDKEKVTKEGTVDDYIDFIEKVISENEC